MKKKYLLNGKIYDEETINSYAQKSGISFDDYLKESGAKEHNDTNTYLLNGKEYDGNTMAEFAQKSNMPYEEYLKEAGVKKKMAHKVFQNYLHRIYNLVAPYLPLYNHN